MFISALKSVFSLRYLVFLAAMTAVSSLVAWKAPTLLQNPVPAGQAVAVKTFNPSDEVEINKSIDHALALRLDGKYDDSFQILYPLAQQGVLRAKLYLGVTYYHGHGVNRDVERARALFLELLEKDYEPGIVNTYLNLIGSMHFARK